MDARYEPVCLGPSYIPSPGLIDRAGVRVLLLDIEGTTTAVSFVYDVLFPFARARLREFLRRAETRLREDSPRSARGARARGRAGPPPWATARRKTRSPPPPPTRSGSWTATGSPRP